MKKFAALFLSLFLMTGTAFADSPKDSPKTADAPAAKTTAAKPATAEKTSAEIAAEVEELRQVLQTQQEELQLLKEELAKRDKQIEDARETAASANSRATEATVKASEAVATSAEAKSTTTALNSTVTNLAASNAAAVSGATAASSQASASTTDDKGPTTIRYKGVNFTPGGFIEAATVNRTRAASADINTPFTGIPYDGNSLSKVSEMNFTARQSRISMLVDSKVGTTALKGYFEADFLGAGTTSNNRQSNSYVFRQRQLWASVGLADGLTFSGGQMWSLATEDKKGIANLQEALPLQIDPQYVVGFTWQRAYGFRVTKTFSDMVSAAISVEGPQITVGGRGFSSYTNTSATGVVTTYQNFWADAPGSGAGFTTHSIRPVIPSTSSLTSSRSWRLILDLDTTKCSVSSLSSAIACILALSPAQPRATRQRRRPQLYSHRAQAPPGYHFSLLTSRARTMTRASRVVWE